MDSSNQPLSATEIMERLRTLPASQYPAEAFASAQAVSKALIPLLIEEIRTVTQSLKEGNEKQSEAILPALALLTDFRAKEAWPVILESVQLSDELIDELYGDAVYDALPSFVDRCASQDLHEIEPLISDVKVPESVRTAFLRAYLTRCAYKELPNERVCAIFKNALESILQETVYGDYAAAHLVAAIVACDPSEDSLQYVERIFEEYPEVHVEYESIFGETDRESLLNMDEYASVKSDRERQYCEELKDWAAFDLDYGDLSNQDSEDDEGEEDEDLWDDLPSYVGHDSTDDEEPEMRFPKMESTTLRQTTPRVGRNELCPCGSGKKYKKCCSRA